jgi:hypothetical protein
MSVRTILVRVGLIAVFAGSAFGDALTLVGAKAIIDNRPLDDPLATGLNLNLDIVVMDSIGGGTALLAGSHTFTSSNGSYPFGHNRSPKRISEK